MNRENIQENRNKNRFLIPNSDILETDDNYFINIEMPGISKDNLNITIEDDQLIISGESVNDNSDKDIQYREFRSCDFERVFSIGNEIDRSKIDAQLENGILEIKLNKSEDTKPRKIQINEIHWFICITDKSVK